MARRDAWILLALHLTRGSPDDRRLRALIGAADYIDHAVPTRDEVAGAFERLGRAGLLVHDADGLHLTDAAAALLESVESRWVRRMHRALVARWEALEHDVGGDPVPLDEAAWETALDAYPD